MPSHHPNHALRAGRKKQGLTQEELAEALGVSSKTVGRWERGLTRPSDYECKRLCQALQQSKEELGLLNAQEEPRHIVDDSNVYRDDGTDNTDGTTLVLASALSRDAHLTLESFSEQANEPLLHSENSGQQKLLPNAEESSVFFRSIPHRAVAPTSSRRRVLVQVGLVGIALSSVAGLMYMVGESDIIGGRAQSPKRVWPIASYNPNQVLPIVRVLQWMLKSRHYGLGSKGVDGFFGNYTMKALHAFQKASKLPVYDTVDTATWEKLIIPSVIDDRGDYVRALQEQLNVRGVSPAVVPDGTFGPKTKSAVLFFQQSYQLPDTGRADLDTWCVLLEGHLS